MFYYLVFTLFCMQERDLPLSSIKPLGITLTKCLNTCYDQSEDKTKTMTIVRITCNLSQLKVSPIFIYAPISLPDIHESIKLIINRPNHSLLVLLTYRKWQTGHKFVSLCKEVVSYLNHYHSWQSMVAHTWLDTRVKYGKNSPPMSTCVQWFQTRISHRTGIITRWMGY